MHPVPKTMGDLPVLHWTPIDSRHRITGACRHFDLSTGSDDPVPAPSRSSGVVRPGST